MLNILIILINLLDLFVKILKKWTLFKDITLTPNSTNITYNISVNQIDTLVANIEGNKLSIIGNSSFRKT